MPVEKWVDAVRDAERRGELLAAFDLAERGLDEHPGRRLAQAPGGAGARARRSDRAGRAAVRRYGLGAVAEDEDIAALARPDRQGRGARRRRRRGAAHWRCAPRRAYEAIFARTGGYYPAINAATLSLLAGDAERGDGARAPSARAARAPRRGAPTTPPRPRPRRGSCSATTSAARAALERAAALHGGDFGARRDDAPAAAARLRAARHRPDAARRARRARPSSTSAATGSPRRRARALPRRARSAVAARIDAEVERQPPATPTARSPAAATSSGPRRCSTRGAELHVVLPFARDEFVADLRRRVPAPAGSSASSAAWRPRPPSATRPRTPTSATTCCTATAPSSRWASRCCAPRYLDADVRQLARVGRRAGARRRQHRDRRRDLAPARRCGRRSSRPRGELLGDGAGRPEPAARPARASGGSSARCCSPTSGASRS